MVGMTKNKDMQTDYNSSYHVKNSSLAPNDELSLDHPPRGIKMEHTFDGIAVIKIRMFSIIAAFGLLFIALFWNGITSIFVCLNIGLTAAHFGWELPDFFLFKDGAQSPDVPFWFLWLFLTPFIAIGLHVIYLTVFHCFGRCEIRISASEGSVFNGFGPLGRTKHFSPQSVKSVGMRESRHVERYALTIEMNNGREIRLPDLGKMRETWLVFALGKILRRT